MSENKYCEKVIIDENTTLDITVELKNENILFVFIVWRSTDAGISPIYHGESIPKKNFGSKKFYATDTWNELDEKDHHLVRQAVNRMFSEIAGWTEDLEDPIQRHEANILSSEDEEKAIEFLKREDKWETIEKQIDREYIGQRASKMWTFIKGLQAYTPVYAQLHIVAITSTGKTKLVDEVFKLFPTDDIEIIYEFSPTALRRMKDLHQKRIIILMQLEGAGKRYHLMMVSRDDNVEGASCIITNMDTGKVEKMSLPHLMFVSTSTNLFLQSEHDTRTDRIFLDEGLKQNILAGEFIAEKWIDDNNFKEALGVLNVGNMKLIKDAINVFGKETYKITVPYMGYLQKKMDFNKQRAKRDLNSIGGALSGITNFNKYNRKYIKLGKEIRLISNAEDLKTCLEFGENNMTQTYYNIPHQYAKIINIIRELTTWMSDGWVYVNDIQTKAEQEGIDRSTLKAKLKKLAEETHYIERDDSYEYENGKKKEDKDGRYIKKRGYSYKFITETPTSIFNKDLDYDEIQQIIEKYEERRQSEGAEILTYDEIKNFTHVAGSDLTDLHRRAT